MVRISRAAHATLRVLSEELGEPMTEVLAKAIEEYLKKRFLEGLNADFAALQADPAARAEHQQDQAAWDATLADGLE